MSDRIHFESFHLGPQRCLLSAYVFVLASVKEPSGLVLVGASKSGCAIIASQVREIPRALDGRSASLLLKDLAYLPYWREQAQQNLKKLSTERMKAETLKSYKEVLEMRK